ncbi:LysR family transcriptional regulator [Micromonospora chersina]|uniref:DNA-binding transcriptional regulator, LysR family n=1 Tax=Micromonospora chersina TaxID=47854 RepID=A0A1C6VIX5_9ACTN|nr:LysR family transcriptional regulator [Micromonospora chersina]SCL66279.1 DNA-binding transcriptional regulator, LysR family [Micromonospora chersina]
MPDDLDLRKVRYFVAVAEELSFIRAAERLHIAQPVLTRQIKVLERELGVELFTRSTRGTRLTPAGAEFLDEARAVLRSATAAQRRVRQTARGGSELTIGFMPGILPTATVRALRERFPELRVEVVRTCWDDQTEMVLDGRIDASFVRFPIDPRGLTVIPLYTEPRVVVLPAGHPLADRERVGLADLALLDLLQEPDAVPEWRDASAALRAGGRRVESRPLRGRTVEEKLELVAGERGIVILPESTARFYTRPDVTHRPVDGLTPHQVALAYEAHRGSPELCAIEEIVREQYPGGR